DRHAWTKRMNMRLLKLEKEIFLSGHEKTFLLFMDSCTICAKCTARREDCKESKLARPTPEAMAMDVYSTVRRAGYPIEVLPDYDRAMNRYSFLLIG
ncbi:MAG: DUF2284 domain-containing protein, partial [Candidatus Aminicenantes bacterium]|nr:DUF2284 domain-containing protein [Candidatus Aminicenantes bacterium]